MKRDLQTYIEKDLPDKIMLLTDARQCGKKTLSKNLKKSFDYFNYDAGEDRIALQKKAWNREKSLLILAELHKMKQWKRWLKGIYDTEGLKPHLLVTGSAKLNVYQKVGDSLVGRYFQYRLHPLDLKEAYRHWKKMERKFLIAFSSVVVFLCF
jgi:predicted AAA+ superfamily ATPase